MISDVHVYNAGVLKKTPKTNYNESKKFIHLDTPSTISLHSLLHPPYEI